MHVKFTAQARKWAIVGALALVGIVVTESASAATVVPTGALNTNRAEHTASLLPNGSVLIAGGRSMPQLYGPMVPVGNAEIYNPASGTFSPTGSMTQPRYMHAAATLANGKVLVVGGSTSTGLYTSTAELFNPATGTWTPTGSMRYARAGAKAVALKDGRVLVVGDQSIGAAAGTCEIYDPATGQFTPSGNLPEPRIGTGAVLLADGRVMLTGGGTAGIPQGNVTPVYADLATLIWSPATGVWNWGPTLAARHMQGTATLLANGKVLVTSGTDWTNKPTANAEIVDPATGSGIATGFLSVPRQNAVATLQNDGTVLMAGGLIYSPGGLLMTASLESYSPTTGTWQSLGNMTTSRFLFTSSLLGNGNVLMTGGATFDPATNVFSVAQSADLLTPYTPPSCVGGGLSIPVSSVPISPSGMTLPFPINAPPSCSWAATTTANWITLTNATGTGNGSFSMAIAPNTWLPRTGAITINPTTTLQVNQAGQAQLCSPQVNSVGPGIGGNFTYSGGSSWISVNANYGCGWQVTGVPSWITLTGLTQGSGPASVAYTVASNNGMHRTATLQIGQLSYTITQN